VRGLPELLQEVAAPDENAIFTVVSRGKATQLNLIPGNLQATRVLREDVGEEALGGSPSALVQGEVALSRKARAGPWSKAVPTRRAARRLQVFNLIVEEQEQDD